MAMRMARVGGSTCMAIHRSLCRSDTMFSAVGQKGNAQAVCQPLGLRLFDESPGRSQLVSSSSRDVAATDQTSRAVRPGHYRCSRGESALADDLLAAGYRDLTVLDISAEAINVIRRGRTACRVRHQIPIAEKPHGGPQDAVGRGSSIPLLSLSGRAWSLSHYGEIATPNRANSGTAAA
jgi:hypothetical protein